MLPVFSNVFIKKILSESLNFLCFHNKKKKINKVFADEAHELTLRKTFERGNSFEEAYKKMSSVF